jgi:hypothetical protein
MIGANGIFYTCETCTSSHYRKITIVNVLTKYFHCGCNEIGFTNGVKIAICLWALSSDFARATLLSMQSLFFIR